MSTPEYLKSVTTAVSRIQDIESEIIEFSVIARDTLLRGNKLIFCGNGGSAADSQHLAAEFMGRFLKDRRPVPAIALTVDTSALTAIGNDYGFDQVFARQLQGIGQTGDLLVGISTSGNSENVVEAVRMAAGLGIKTVAMTGESDSVLSSLADLTIRAPSTQTNHIQECHIVIGHLVCKIVEEDVFP